MKRLGILFAFLSCSFLGGALAQTVGGGIIQAFANSFPSVFTQNGTTQFVFNHWAAQFWELSQGTSGTPVATAGPLFKISRTEAMNATSCNSNTVDSECNSALSVYSMGSASDGMQTAAIYAGAQSGSPMDNVGLLSTGRTTGSGSGIGTGAYLEGRTDSTAGKNIGAEIRSTNLSGIGQAFNPTGFSSGSIWATAGGNAKSGCGICIANAGQSYDVGFAAANTSTINQTFRDDSSAVTSVQVNGAHTYGVDLTAGTFSGAPILAPLTTPASSTAACKQGATEWDASFIYICTATNTWKRATLAAF